MTLFSVKATPKHQGCHLLAIKAPPSTHCREDWGERLSTWYESCGYILVRIWATMDELGGQKERYIYIDVDISTGQKRVNNVVKKGSRWKEIL